MDPEDEVEPAVDAAAAQQAYEGLIASARSSDEAQPRDAAAGGAAAPPPELRPVGQGDYVVAADDCIMSIADAHGLFWKTIWDDPANAELKRTRGDPRVLLPGDRVTIPAKRVREESGATDGRHRFRRHGVPAKVRLRLLKDGQPRAREDCVIRIDGALSRKKTDGSGVLEIAIPPGARQGEVRVGAGDDAAAYQLALGSLNPHASVSGVQQRLRNLGFYHGAIDGVAGPATRAAVKEFQAGSGIPATGDADEDTCKKLKEQHGA